MRKTGSWMREHTPQCQQGVFSEDKLLNYECFTVEATGRGPFTGLGPWQDSPEDLETNIKSEQECPKVNVCTLDALASVPHEQVVGLKS